MGKTKEQEKKKTSKKRRPNAAYYFERHHGRNMMRRALRMIRREAKYQCYLKRKNRAKADILDSRRDRVLVAARLCAEQHGVLGRFNTELGR